MFISITDAAFHIIWQRIYGWHKQQWYNKALAKEREVLASKELLPMFSDIDIRNVRGDEKAEALCCHADALLANCNPWQRLECDFDELKEQTTAGIDEAFQQIYDPRVDKGKAVGNLYADLAADYWARKMAPYIAKEFESDEFREWVAFRQHVAKQVKKMSPLACARLHHEVSEYGHIKAYRQLFNPALLSRNHGVLKIIINTISKDDMQRVKNADAFMLVFFEAACAHNGFVAALANGEHGNLAFMSTIERFDTSKKLFRSAALMQKGQIHAAAITKLIG